MRHIWGGKLWAVGIFLGLTLIWTSSAKAAELAGRLIFLEGQVTVRPAGTDQWQKARLHQDLSGGDTIRTGAYSRAAILCMDESQIRLNQNTVLTLKSVAPSPRLRLGEIAPAAQAGEAVSNYQVIQGEIWLRNKKEKFLFELETPTVTATIRGTELNARVQPDGTTSIIMLEGEVKLANRFGEIILVAGEEGLVQPGKAPTKQVLVQPDNAVQWSLFYPGYFSYRDLPLQALEGGGPSGRDALLAQGVAAYDQGRMTEALTLAQQVLARDPRNPQALTLAGWVHLQLRQPEEALGFFQKVSPPGLASLVGAALARYQTGDAVGAYLLMKEANAGQPILKAMTGYFAMLLGRTEEARSLFNAAAAGSSPVAQLLALAYLAQMAIVQNRKDEARSQADKALALTPASPLALLTRALVDIADFQLPAARQRLETALDIDPNFLDATLYLGKLYLGGNYFTKARRVADHALRQAPQEARVLSLAGFVNIAFRDYEKARELFTKSISKSPQLADAHLGLALCQFRFQAVDQALTEMLTATLLDPRISSYQTELGKAFYQVRNFDKALATWDYAAKLDPKDPMPHFYKGIALTDLNRPGEAIQSINRSIFLNDNRAVFRSPIMLARDMSAETYNLARAYSQLGLGEWAQSKAITAVKLDPLNGLPHLFLARSFLATGQRVAATNTESLLYTVLSPANQNTFRYLLENDYTSMFEMPYARATVQGGVGSWQESKAIHEDIVAAYGGLPAAAFQATGEFINDGGFRKQNGDIKSWRAFGTFKGEPTVRDNLTAFVQYTNINQGDPGPLNDYFYRSRPNLRLNIKLQAYEFSYLNRLTPTSAFLAYYSHHDVDQRTYATFTEGIDRDVWQVIPFRSSRDISFDNVQVQQQLILGKHTLLGGFDYFYGLPYLQQNGEVFLVFSEGVLPLGQFSRLIRPPEKSYSFYLLDYWRLTPWVLVELGLFRDVTRNSRAEDPRSISNNLWSPRVGFNIQIGSRHIVRLALMRYLNTHLILNPLLVPTEVAGLTWVGDTEQGAEVRAVGGSWEAQWDPKTFTVLRFEAFRVSTPEYFFTADGASYNAWATWRRYQASFFLNRILTNSLGLTLGVTGKRVIPDESYRDPLNFSTLLVSNPLESFTEVNGLLDLSFLTPKGWQGGVRTRLVYQYLRNFDSNNLFALVNLRFGKELAKKRGLILFEVQNLFNRHSGYLVEPSLFTFSQDFFPARRIIGKVQLWF